ncbi:MAG: aminoglycoside phosphotransferase family protein, partial [Clostridiales bacterium]|nr:aminoglycoside phosphotransferase family protein [Clostridiales bacterium]
EDKVLNGYVEGFGILADAFRKIHAAPIDGIKMPPMIATAGMGLSEEDRNTIFPIINRLSEKYPPCICHLDMHFLNIMIPNGAMDAALEKKTYPEFVIIDWMNARIAPAVFDYARTYVIFDEFSQEGLAIYKQAVEADIKALGISDEDFQDALKVSTVIRKREKN